MALLRRAIFEALAACALVACGARPDPPGPAVGDGTGTAAELVSGEPKEADVEVEVPSLEPTDEPDAAAPEPLLPEPPDGEKGDGEPKPGPLGQSLAACTVEGVDCNNINVAVSDRERDVCIQLTIDNCGGFSRAGLPVDLPVSWRLGSASLDELADGCAPGGYDPDNVIIVDASGSISWNEETPQPTEVVIDVTLVPSRTSLNSEPIDIAQGLLDDPLPECD
jgi:hypothetical protein